MRPKVVCLHLLATLMFASTLWAAPMPVEGTKDAAADDVSDPVATLFILDANGRETRKNPLPKEEEIKRATKLARKRVFNALDMIEELPDAKRVLGGKLIIFDKSGSATIFDAPTYFRLDITKGPNKGSSYVGWTAHLKAEQKYRRSMVQCALYYRVREVFGVLRFGRSLIPLSSFTEHDEQFRNAVDYRKILKLPDNAPESAKSLAAVTADVSTVSTKRRKSKPGSGSEPKRQKPIGSSNDPPLPPGAASKAASGSPSRPLPNSKPFSPGPKSEQQTGQKTNGLPPDLESFMNPSPYR